MDMDEKLYKIVDAVKDWVVIYVVDNKVGASSLTYSVVSKCS
jgi:DIM1 family U5 snRNP protein